MTEPGKPERTAGALPVERVRGARPEDEAWRADALAGSRHSRWADELRQPLELHDLDRAEEICRQVTRLALQDYAPALMLLAGRPRRQVQALTAYTLVLLDFACQTGLEGEKLTAINRWEFELEAALDGHPTGQPVFVLLHSLEQEGAWAREGFDRLHSAARHRAVQIRPRDRAAAEAEALQLGGSLAWLLLGREPSEEVARFAAALLRLRGLANLGDDLRRHRARLPVSELPDSWSAGEIVDRESLATALANEVESLHPDLAKRDLHRHLPANLRAAWRYARGAALCQLDGVRRVGNGVLQRPPQVGFWLRLGLLVRSRWRVSG